MCRKGDRTVRGGQGSWKASICMEFFVYSFAGVWCMIQSINCQPYALCFRRIAEAIIPRGWVYLYSSLPNLTCHREFVVMSGRRRLTACIYPCTADTNTHLVRYAACTTTPRTARGLIHTHHADSCRISSGQYTSSSHPP